jgi:hypothetical protein
LLNKLHIKGGPCGVLASVQAYILIELFFSSNQQNNEQNLSNDLLLLNCLTKAVCNILWKIGRKRRAVVAKYIKSFFKINKLII